MKINVKGQGCSRQSEKEKQDEAGRPALPALTTYYKAVIAVTGTKTDKPNNGTRESESKSSHIRTLL